MLLELVSLYEITNIVVARTGLISKDFVNLIFFKYPPLKFLFVMYLHKAFCLI